MGLALTDAIISHKIVWQLQAHGIQKLEAVSSQTVRVYMCVHVCLWHLCVVHKSIFYQTHVGFYHIQCTKNWHTGKNPCYWLKWIWRQQVRD